MPPTASTEPNVTTQFPSVIQLPWKARLGVTTVFTILYIILFLIILIQVILIFYYRYKRLSYRMVVFSLCLVWAGLRAVMFALYFDPSFCTVAFDLPVGVYWLLYALPVCFQFAVLAMFALYFIQVVVKDRARDVICHVTLRTHLYGVWGIFNLIFFVVNTMCAIISYQQFNEQRYPDDSSMPNMGVFTQPKNSPYLYVRVSITEGLFLIVAAVNSACIVKIARNSSHRLTLETQGMSVVQTTVAAMLIVVMYTSRTVCNLVALGRTKEVDSFGYDWPIASDEAEFGGDAGTGYVTFSVALAVWELLPTLIMTLYFRVKRPVSRVAEKEVEVTNSYFKKPTLRRPLLISKVENRGTHDSLTRSPSLYGSVTTISSNDGTFNSHSSSSGYRSSGRIAPTLSINT